MQHIYPTILDHKLNLHKILTKTYFTKDRLYPYLYEVKLLVNEIDLLVDDFHLFVQQEFICIKIGRAMC